MVATDVSFSAGPSEAATPAPRADRTVTAPEAAEAAGVAEDRRAQAASPSSQTAVNHPRQGQPRTSSGNQPAQRDGEARATQEQLPSTLLVRHRMGFSVVKLSQYQQTHYGRDDLEDFILYKEQKYNAVNTLSRFMLTLVFFLVVTIFCVAFAVCSPNWHLVRYRNYNAVIGIFTACTERVYSQCTTRKSAHWERAVTDSLTGEEVCSVRGGFLRNYIGAMWSLAILQLLGLTLLVLLSAWISLRPTRSRALLTVVLLSLLCLFCNIINCVLFSVYVRCDRKTCAAHHLSERYCKTEYMWGYKLYIAAAALHAVVFLIALSMSTFVQHIYVRAATQLHRERSLRARQDFLNDYIRNLVDTMTVEPPTGRHGDDVEEDGIGDTQAHDKATALTTNPQGRPARAPAGTQEPSVFTNPSADTHSSRRQKLIPSLVRPEIEKDASLGTRVHLYVDMQPGSVGGDDRASSPRRPRAEAPALKSHSAPASLQPSRTTSILVKNQRRPYATGQPHASAEAAGDAPAATRNRALQNTEAAKKADEKKKKNIFRYIRRHQAQLVGMLGRREGDDYITAEELGVRIPGASDWLYDDRSDMYYSYELNMFWDPITREYFNCALQTWQEEPHEVVEIRDAMELAEDTAFLNELNDNY